MSAIFSRRQPQQASGKPGGINATPPESAPAPPPTSTFKPNSSSQPTDDSADEDVPYKPKLAFHCQQAQGSPTGIISGFTNVKELYKKIADCYDMDPSEVSREMSLKIPAHIQHTFTIRLFFTDFAASRTTEFLMH